jgi:hypothetical protein
MEDNNPNKKDKKKGFVNTYLKPIANNFGMGVGRSDQGKPRGDMDVPALYEVNDFC